MLVGQALAEGMVEVWERDPGSIEVGGLAVEERNTKYSLVRICEITRSLWPQSKVACTFVYHSTKSRYHRI